MEAATAPMFHVKQRQHENTHQLESLLYSLDSRGPCHTRRAALCAGITIIRFIFSQPAYSLAGIDRPSDGSNCHPAMLKELGAAANALNLQTSQPAAWKGLLASFYGGIAEEIQLRLLVMSFLVWLGRFLSKTAEGKPTRAIFWIAN